MKLLRELGILVFLVVVAVAIFAYGHQEVSNEDAYLEQGTENLQYPVAPGVSQSFTWNGIDLIGNMVVIHVASADDVQDFYSWNVFVFGLWLLICFCILLQVGAVVTLIMNLRLGTLVILVELALVCLSYELWFRDTYHGYGSDLAELLEIASVGVGFLLALAAILVFFGVVDPETD